ncbi:MAG: hypothetical protein WCS01_12780 [bacterium]
MMRQNQAHHPQGRPAKSDKRYQQLLDLARGGDETAVHDLWAEYQFDFHKERSGHE